MDRRRARLAAVKSLGREAIHAIDVGEVSEIEAEIIEISENLHRSELTKEQKDAQILRYVKLLEMRDAEEDEQEHEMGGTAVPPTDATGRRKSPQQKEGIATRASRDLNVSKRHVNRVIREDRDPQPNKFQNLAGRARGSKRSQNR